MFRYKKSVPVSYERQGYIYFASRLYRELTEEQQRKLGNGTLTPEHRRNDHHQDKSILVSTSNFPNANGTMRSTAADDRCTLAG